MHLDPILRPVRSLPDSDTWSSLISTRYVGLMVFPNLTGRRPRKRGLEYTASGAGAAALAVLRRQTGQPPDRSF